MGILFSGWKCAQALFVLLRRFPFPIAPLVFAAFLRVLALPLSGAFPLPFELFRVCAPVFALVYAAQRLCFFAHGHCASVLPVVKFEALVLGGRQIVQTAGEVDKLLHGVLAVEENDRQYLTRSERDKENHFVLTFSARADTLPTLKGLNFDERDAFIIEKTDRNDSICYWIKDSLIYQMDTLEIQMDYLATDTLDRLVPQTDTLFLANKLTRAEREKLEAKAAEEKEKERKKKEKKGEKIEPEPTKFLTLNVDAPSAFDLDRNVYLSFDEPVASIDTAAIHMEIKKDSLWEEIPFLFVSDSVLPRKYEILAEWEPEKEYQLSIDSMAFKGVYGLHTNKVKQTMKVKKLNEYGTILLNITGADSTAVVELLDGSGKVLRQQRITPQNTADFYYLNPGTKFYIRLFNDRNGNGVWDTGKYSEHLQPEEVYYFPKVWEMKANFDFEENWNINAVPVEKQKLDEIKKQKPEETKKIQDRNKERARKLGR